MQGQRAKSIGKEVTLLQKVNHGYLMLKTAARGSDAVCLQVLTVLNYQKQNAVVED